MVLKGTEMQHDEIEIMSDDKIIDLAQRNNPANWVEPETQDYRSLKIVNILGAVAALGFFWWILVVVFSL